MSSFRCTFSRWLQQNEQKSETPERKSEASHDGSDTDAVEVCEARGGGVSEVTADVSLLGNHTVVSISVFLYFFFWWAGEWGAEGCLRSSKNQNLPKFKFSDSRSTSALLS